MRVSTPTTASGTCRCHGVMVSGPLALVSRPRQPYWETDLLTGQRVAVWYVLTATGGHDIAVAGASVTYE